MTQSKNDILKQIEESMGKELPQETRVTFEDLIARGAKVEILADFSDPNYTLSLAAAETKLSIEAVDEIFDSLSSTVIDTTLFGRDEKHELIKDQLYISEENGVRIVETIDAGGVDEIKEFLGAFDDVTTDELLAPETFDELADYDIAAAQEAMSESVSTTIRKRVEAAGDNFYANSNISEHIRGGELSDLIDEATEAFEKVLDVLVIDRKNDPNSMDTGRRLAKMYIKELMEGRYSPAPSITAFPNKHTGKETGFSGLLVVRSEIKSMCSHHHQTVDGVAYIGIIPKEKVIGLSKYTRMSQWLARRGTLQEELAEDIAHGIMLASESDDVAVYIEATHGCCENRGIMAANSSTQTTALYGEFMTDPTVRKEFHDNIMMQKMNK